MVVAVGVRVGLGVRVGVGGMGVSVGGADVAVGGGGVGVGGMGVGVGGADVGIDGGDVGALVAVGDGSAPHPPTAKTKTITARNNKRNIFIFNLQVQNIVRSVKPSSSRRLKTQSLQIMYTARVWRCGGAGSERQRQFIFAGKQTFALPLVRCLSE